MRRKRSPDNRPPFSFLETERIRLSHQIRQTATLGPQTRRSCSILTSFWMEFPKLNSEIFSCRTRIVYENCLLQMKATLESNSGLSKNSKQYMEEFSDKLLIQIGNNRFWSSLLPLRVTGLANC